MAERDIDIQIEDDQEEMSPGPGAKQARGNFSGIFIDILKWAVIILAAIVFIVSVVIVTLQILRSNDALGASNLPDVVVFQDNIPDELDWYTQLGDIRGSTIDEPRKTFIISPVIGYTVESNAVLQELIRRSPQIKERIRIYFASRSAVELEGAENYIRIKNELREQVNRIMRQKIREVVFDTFQILDF